jgi:hypothetical protein
MYCIESTVIGQFTSSGGPVLNSVLYLAVAMTTMFWTLSTTTNLKFCPSNFVFQFHTKLVWSLLVSTVPTRVGTLKTFMEPGLNRKRRAHVNKIVVLFEKKRSPGA